MATIQVTTAFVVNTRIKSAEVNQNFTDLVNIIKGDHHNVAVYSNAQPITTSGIAPNAQIADTQLRSQITRSGLINESALGSIASPGIIARTALSLTLPFAGNGGDAALSISSGTTTVDVGAAQVYILNYTSVSITGTGKLDFTNPHANGTTVILRSQGNMTLTSSTAPMIDMSGMGAIGGVGPTRSTNGNSNGENGTDGYALTSWFTDHGDGPTSFGGTTADGGLAASINGVFRLLHAGGERYPHTCPGAGGGSGAVTFGTATGSMTGGDGGRGGGVLIIECGGAWNFTTSGGISVAGAAGVNASGSGSGATMLAGGGGGGGGGFCLVLVTSITANTGTISSGGGAGGSGLRLAGGSGNRGPGGGGGGGVTSAGSSGEANDNAASAGGAGGAGFSLVAVNTEIA